MSSKRTLVVAAVAIVILVFAGGKYFASTADTPAAAATGAADPQGARKGGRGGASDGTPVVTAVVAREDFPILKRSIGWVESQAVVAIKTRVDSQIVEQRVTDGQIVNTGELLFVLDDREQQAQLAKDQATLARDQALHARTKLDLARVQNLNSKGSASQQQLDQSTSDERSAAANVKGDEAAVAMSMQKLSYTKIYAPIDGRIGAVQVAPGNLVSANNGATLVTITRIRPIRVTFTMPERELPALKAAVASSTAPQVRVFQKGTHEPIAVGQLTFLDSTVDIPSGTVTVKAVFDNADLALWPGQYVDVELDMDPLHNVAVVPTVAVQPGQKGSFVYLVKPDDTIELRTVTVAGTNSDRTAVSAGLEAGDRVVIDGQTGLITGSKVRQANGRTGTASAAEPAASSVN